MFLYVSHMGGLYLTKEEQETNDLYCDTCGDMDRYLGQVDTPEDVHKAIANSQYKGFFDEHYVDSVARILVDRDDIEEKLIEVIEI